MNRIFIKNNVSFEIDGNKTNAEQINSTLKYDFKGKNDFIEFYLSYNGIYFPKGAFIKRSNFYTVNKNEYDELEVEYFYEIPNRLLEMWNATKEHSEEAKVFAEYNIPFARDAAGNDFWIEIETGIVKYISWEYDFPEAITIITNLTIKVNM